MIIQGDNLVIGGNTVNGANIGKLDDYISVDVNNRISTVDMIATQSFRIGDDAHWKIRPNNGNQELCFEYSTSNVMSDANIKARINSSGHLLMPNRPAFHAQGLNTVVNNSICVWPTIRFNIGGHYNATNGRFTAPVSGMYVFGWTNIGKDINDVYRWRFNVNGSNVGDLHLRQDTNASGSEYATNGMYTIPWSLNAGDYVSIYFVSDGGNLPYGSGNTGDDYPRFWGYLLG